MSAISSTQLLSKGPNECLKFIRENFPSKFDWLRLAEGAASNSASYIVLGEKPLEMGLEWIRVAVELYERMADHPNVEQESRVRLSESAIAKRAQAIEIWGAKDDDSVLSLKDLIVRFKLIVDISPEELRADANIPRSSGVRTALLVTQFVEPLLKIDALKTQLQELQEIAEYCEAAKNARENARTRIINKE